MVDRLLFYWEVARLAEQLLCFFVLKIAGVQGSWVDLLLAHKLLRARAHQHLALLRHESKLATHGLTGGLGVYEKLRFCCFANFLLPEICLGLLHRFFQLGFPQLLGLNQRVVRAVCLRDGVSHLNLRLLGWGLNFSRFWHWLGFDDWRRQALSFYFFRRGSHTFLRGWFWFLLSFLQRCFFVCLCNFRFLLFAVLFLLYLFFQGLVSFGQNPDQLAGLKVVIGRSTVRAARTIPVTGFIDVLVLLKFTQHLGSEVFGFINGLQKRFTRSRSLFCFEHAL